MDGWQRPLRAFRSRTARLAGLSLVGVVFTVAAAYVLMPLIVQGFVAAVDAGVGAGIWLATLAGGGADRSTILMAIGREAFTAFASPRALAIIGALVLLGAAAIYGLQQLLGLDDN
jgi:hypothetical protein